MSEPRYDEVVEHPRPTYIFAISIPCGSCYGVGEKHIAYVGEGYTSHVEKCPYCAGTGIVGWRRA